MWRTATTTTTTTEQLLQLLNACLSLSLKANRQHKEASYKAEVKAKKKENHTKRLFIHSSEKGMKNFAAEVNENDME